MQYNGPTIELRPTVPERLFSPGFLVERTLRVWSISRWRGSRWFAEWFLRAGFAHLPAGSPVMFRLDDVGPNSRTPPIGHTVTFTNSFDASYLLSKVIDLSLEVVQLVLMGKLRDHHVIGIKSSFHHPLALEDWLLQCFEPCLHASGLLRSLNIRNV
ncbi:hypothetical protein D1007_34271 [Hordeum vulgare]|nr:hypothetical protein D1007_34271 [Hordeum vulgare]